MADMEYLAHQSRHLSQYILLGTGGALDDKVSTHDILAAGQGPDMQIMDILNAFNRPDARIHFSDIDAIRNPLQQDVHAFFEQNPGSGKHPQADGCGNDRVNPSQSGKTNDQCCPYYAYGAQHVTPDF